MVLSEKWLHELLNQGDQQQPRLFQIGFHLFGIEIEKGNLYWGIVLRLSDQLEFIEL